MSNKSKTLDDLDLKIRAAKRQKAAIEARADFLKFVKMTMPDPNAPDDFEESLFKDAKHHRALAKVLEKVEKGHHPRLIVTMPPRHGKSELISRRFIPWMLGRDSYRNVIFATYNEDFAGDFGADVRAIMQQPTYRQIFPDFNFRKGGASKSRIQTSRGGLGVFVGRGGSITGRGGDFIILDDPIKDSIEASSPTLREQLWTWFTQVLMTRLMTAGASIVIVQTRWHEDDLVGRLTDPTNPHYTREEAEKWHIINLPALAEENDPLGREEGALLWPERFDMEFMEAQRRLDSRGFSALYQQHPTPEDGDLFQRSDLRYYDKANKPDDLRIYAASDHAVGTDKSRNDATCMLIVGVDGNDDIYLLDTWWEKQPADKSVDAMINLIKKWKPLIWWAEKGHITKSIGPFLRKRMAEEKAYCRIEEVTPTANKVQRSQSIQGRIAMGKVYFPKVSPWTQKAIDEILKFPNARHDDFVDTISYIGMGLTRFATPGQQMRAQSDVPEVGTLAWIKYDSKMRERDRKANDETGGF